MVKPENRIDKKRFEERKSDAKRTGASEGTSVQKAARSVKNQREAEGRSKR